MTDILVHGAPIDYDAHGYLPEHMKGAMKRYIENRIPPGDFLTAVLTNDLFEAVGRADDINKHKLHDYAMWLYNFAPSGCFGSREAVRNWLKRGE